MARQNIFSEESAHHAEKSAHRAEKSAHRAEKSVHHAEKSAHHAEKSAHSAPYNNIIIKKENNNNNVVADVDDNCEVDLVLAFAVRATGAGLKSSSFSCHFTSRHQQLSLGQLVLC